MKYEEIMEMNYKIIDAIKYTQEISKLPDCNDCDRKECKHRPKLGEKVRINCYSHVEKK